MYDYLFQLKRIECIDVAEQSLMALEVMSKRNGKNIMAAVCFILHRFSGEFCRNDITVMKW